jgi:phosphoribosylglycinamide formyltransferase 1
MKKIVLFASGSGTNAENIILHFQKSSIAKVSAVFSNNSNALVLEKAAKHQLATFVFSKEALTTGAVLEELRRIQPDLIVLAGFLLQFPTDIIRAYPGKIINIHPALLPKYGGKGMYGMHVHRAIFENKESETGISIHYVNDHYDEGKMIFQQSVSIADCMSCEAIAEKIHALEHEHFPKVIENLLTKHSQKTTIEQSNTII